MASRDDYRAKAVEFLNKASRSSEAAARGDLLVTAMAYMRLAGLAEQGPRPERARPAPPPPWRTGVRSLVLRELPGSNPNTVH